MTNNDKEIKNFYLMIVDYLKEDSRKAAKTFLQEPSEFNAGVVQGYYNAFSLIKSQAEIFSDSFDISLKEMNLSDFDPDSELFSKK